MISIFPFTNYYETLWFRKKIAPWRNFCTPCRFRSPVMVDETAIDDEKATVD